ncbi:MAG: hypothetical protein ABDH32_04370 [Candidatus Caldarchaeales archaeon]
MSKVFRRALKYVKDEISSSESGKALLEIEFPEFSEGEFVINFYVDSNPLLLGRKFPESKIDLSPDNIRHIIRIGHLHGCVVNRVGEEFYYQRDGEVVAIIGKRFYAASEPNLFEEISREIYGLGRRIELDRPVGWLKAFKLLLSRS